MNRHDNTPFVITGHDVLGEILRRNTERKNAERVARQLGIATRRKTHRASLGDREQVESNLPLP